MSNRGNRFKKIGSKLKNFSDKVDDFVLGPDFNSNNKNKNDFSNLDHIIVPEHNDGNIPDDFSGSEDGSPFKDSGDGSSFSGSEKSSSFVGQEDDSSHDSQSSYNSGNNLDTSNIGNHSNGSLNDNFNKFSDDLKEHDGYMSSDDEVDEKYSGYLDTGLESPKEKYLNEFKFDPSDSGSPYPHEDNSDDEGFSYSEGKFNSRYHDAFHGSGSSSESTAEPLSDGIDDLFGNYTDGRFNDEAADEKTGFRDSLKNFKKELLNKDAKSKSHFGKIAFVLIFLILASSMLYFMVYQPFSEELNLEKNAKLNELNALYKGPLEVHENAYSLKNQIESTYDIEEVKSIDVLRSATEDWKTYQKSSIVKCRDNYGRIMLTYADNDTRNIILSVSDAQDFVADNDARVLSNVQFKKVDTVIVPLSLSRLQATAGLIYVGSIVDIYSLDENETYDYSDSDSDSQEITVESDDNASDGESAEDSTNLSDEDALNDSSSPDYDTSSSTDKLNLDRGPDVSGATVLAILRSKDSGVVESKFSRSSLSVSGNVSNPKEKTNSFSTDVEELLKASAFGSYSGNEALESYMDSYGVKLSDYERMSNLGELDSEYIILLEVPRTDVDFIINNMDNLILTIPTQFAPDWVANELSQTYYEDLTSQSSDD